MIDLVVIAISALMLALAFVWWRWPAFRAWIEAPKYFMLRQERRFDEGATYPSLGSKPADPE
jgi:Flp pilus assembly protein TadB